MPQCLIDGDVNGCSQHFQLVRQLPLVYIIMYGIIYVYVSSLCFVVCQINIKVIATKNALHFFDKSALHVLVFGEEDETQVLCFLYIRV